MFSEEVSTSIQPGHAFVDQSSVAGYAHPSRDAEVVTRLSQTSALLVLPTHDEIAGFIPVQVDTGQAGFVLASAGLTTVERLLFCKAEIRHGFKLGWIALLAGGTICLLLCTLMIYVVYFADNGSHGKVAHTM